MAGVHVQLEVDSPTGCPIAETTRDSGATVDEVSWTDDGETRTEQFEVSGATDPPAEDVVPVFEHENGTVYEFERGPGPCACERLEAAGVPAAAVSSFDGGLMLSIHLSDVGALGGVVDEVRGAAEDVTVASITRSASDAEEGESLVPVDRGRLTDRQLEVLATAHAMGYYDYPREANASEVAAALDICPSTLTEHLSAAQRKLLDQVLRNGTA